jgi:hypothetical protein
MKKDQVRQTFPQACGMADELRSAFGDGVKLVYLKEGDHELGKLSERGVNPSIPGDAFVQKKRSRDDE